MKRSNVISTALEIIKEGKVAYICYDGSVLDARKKPSGDIVLKVRPGETSTSKSLSILLSHRMRMMGMRGSGKQYTVSPANVE